MTARIFIARAVAGSIGESRRVSHVFSVPLSDEVPAHLTAYCGANFGPDELELLDGPTGMPCESCLRVTLSPAGKVTV